MIKYKGFFIYQWADLQGVYSNVNDNTNPALFTKNYEFPVVFPDGKKMILIDTKVRKGDISIDDTEAFHKMENDAYIKAIDIIKDLIKKGEVQNDSE